MLNEKFWLAIAFFTFIAIVIKIFGKKITTALDNKSRSIAQEIITAKEARKKAEELLAQSEIIYQQSIESAKKLVSEAEIEANKLMLHAQETLNIEINKMARLASQRIQSEEESAIREIKTKIVLGAIQQLQDKSLLNKNEQSRVIEKSIKNFERIH